MKVEGGGGGGGGGLKVMILAWVCNMGFTYGGWWV